MTAERVPLDEFDLLTLRRARHKIEARLLEQRRAGLPADPRDVEAWRESIAMCREVHAQIEARP